MIAIALRRFFAATVVSAALLFCGGLTTTAGAAGGSTGLAVVIANGYDEILPASLRDANAIADKLEQNGFTTIRLLGAAGSELAAGVAQIRQAAESAGPLRLVYMSGFGMCANDDIVLFAEDMQPEQFKSGQIGDVVVPLSLVAEAASSGADRTLVVFDINPRQCTRGMVDAVKLPENAALLITTGIGGDVIDEIDDGGMSAFATAFVGTFAADRPIKDIVTEVVAQIKEMTDGQQAPILVGEL
jgi:Caspase domain